MSVKIQSGMRLTPTRLNPEECIVTRSAAQSVASGGVGSAMSFTAEDSDTASMWSSGGAVTIQVAGTYALTGNLVFAAGATGSRSVNIQVNGTNVAEQKRANTNQSDPLSVSVTKRLGVGDVVTLWAFHTQGAALNVSGTSLSVCQTRGA